MEEPTTDLSKRDLTIYSNGIWRDIFPARSAHAAEHGATFPAELIQRIVQIYSEKWDTILDPFVGTGSSLVACQMTRRHGIGIELNPTYYKYATTAIGQSTLEEMMGGQHPILKVHRDDCRNVAKYVQPDSIQLVVSSPPYADMIRKSMADREKRTNIWGSFKISKIKPYSDSDKDLGNLGYDTFMTEMLGLMKTLFPLVKVGGYVVWVVKDYRDVEHGLPYVPFHSDLAQMGRQAGFKWHDLIVWDQSQHRKLHLLGSKRVFYTNQNYSFLVVLRKT